MTDELRLFKASVDHANDEIFWFNFEANILYVNDAASRITGYSQEELLSMKVYELNPVVNPDMWAGFMTTLRKDGGVRFETRHRRKNGEIIDVEIVATYVTKDSSEYSIAFVRNITDRKRDEQILLQKNEELKAAYEQQAAVEQELRQQFDNLAFNQKLLQESETKFHSVFNNANDAIFMHIIGEDGPGRFLEVNDFMCRSLGYTREELLTMTVKDILSGDNQKKVPEIGQGSDGAGRDFFLHGNQTKRRNGISR